MSIHWRSAQLYAAAAVFLVSISCMANGQVLSSVPGLVIEQVPLQNTLESVEKEAVMAKCTIRCNYEPCNVIIQFDREDELKDVFAPLSNWKDLVYDKKCSLLDGNRKSCTMVIPSINSHYYGDYRCTWWEISNRNNNESFYFLLASAISEPSDNLEPLTCILPKASNILAFQTFAEDQSSATIELTWDVSVEEDDYLEPCVGGKNWRVRFSTYDKNIPENFEPSDNGFYSEWEDVQDEDTNHTLDININTSFYYLFEVSHQPDTLKSGASKHAESFASQVYYYGVQEPARIDRSHANSITTLSEGQNTEIKCVATGIPPPLVTFTGGNFKTNGSIATLSLTGVTEADEGTYLCIASNAIVSLSYGKEYLSDAVGFVVEVKEYDPSITGIDCQYLEGYVGHCDDFLQPEFSYFTNYSTALAHESTAGKLMSAIDSILLNKSCRSLAYAMVCNTLYAPCDVQPGLPSPRMICPSACEEFSKSGDCAGLIGPEHEDVYAYVSQCDASGNEAGDSPECVPLSLEAPRIDEFETIEDTGSCMRGDGRGFSGLHTKTTGNKDCQSWELDFPHKHPMLPDIFPTDLKKANSEQSCRNPGGIGDRPWCYTEDLNVRWDYCDIPKCDSCQDYQGSVCQSLPGYSSNQVLVRKGMSISGQEELEKDIVHIINSVKLYHVLTPGCEDFLVTALCQTTFPFCQENSEDQPLKLCSDHCQLFANLQSFCPSVYTQYQKYVSEHVAMVSSVECEVDTKSNDECIPLPPPADCPPNSSQNLTINCYTDQGENYRGTASHTLSNVPCLPWDSNKPHTAFITVENYPELDGAENYCRNPGCLLTDPWCYTSSGDKEWDYCDIPLCQQQGPPVDLDEFVEDDSEVLSSGSLVVTILSVLLVIVFILLVAVGIVASVMLYFRRRSSRKRRQQTPFRVTNIISEEKYLSNPDYTMQVTTLTSTPSAVTIPDSFQHIDKNRITYVSQLGQGNFGVVFKGKIVDVVEGSGEVEVAVKTLKEEAAAEMVSSFVEEAKLMFTFDHPNILTIYGVCMSDFPYQMVFEYMEEGDLTQFLRSRASSSQRRLLFPFSYRSRTESSFSNDPPSLTKSQLLHISEQIASGMAYLSAKNHVHRDLACRNCLIKKDLTIKIGDFGMSRNLYSRDYYRINGQAILPVRWMSPEALIYGKFSVEGDVWSFGVVMWEVFSFALQPYYGISNEEVTEFIRRGRTLRRPDYCPMDVFKVMQECWNMEPNDRPTFDELHKMLNELHELASMSDDDRDDTMSTDSDMPSDAFYSDGVSIDDDLA